MEKQLLRMKIKTGLTNGELSKFRSRFSFKEKQCGSALIKSSGNTICIGNRKLTYPPRFKNNRRNYNKLNTTDL